MAFAFRSTRSILPLSSGIVKSKLNEMSEQGWELINIAAGNVHAKQELVRMGPYRIMELIQVYYTGMGISGEHRHWQGDKL